MAHIRTEIDGHIAWLLFDRPEKLNAMTVESWGEMGDALIALGKEPEVRCLIIAGEGRAFLAGHDVNEMRQHTRDFAAGTFKPSDLHEGQKKPPGDHPANPQAALSGDRRGPRLCGRRRL